jgi:hypothetical protein
MYIDIWSSLILGIIIIINTVNSMPRIYYTKCISNTNDLGTWRVLVRTANWASGE